MGFGKGGINRNRYRTPQNSSASTASAFAFATTAAFLSPQQQSQCGQQQRAPSKALADDSRKRGRDFTEGEKLHILWRWGKLPTDGGGRKIGVDRLCKDLSAEFGKTVHPNFIGRSVLGAAEAADADSVPSRSRRSRRTSTCATSPSSARWSRRCTSCDVGGATLTWINWLRTCSGHFASTRQRSSRACGRSSRATSSRSSR